MATKDIKALIKSQDVGGDYGVFLSDVAWVLEEAAGDEDQDAGRREALTRAQALVAEGLLKGVKVTEEEIPYRPSPEQRKRNAETDALLDHITGHGPKPES